MSGMDSKLSDIFCVIFMCSVFLCDSEAWRAKNFRVLFLNATV